MAIFSKRLVEHVLKWEGAAITNDPDDKGGLTNKGVTYALYNLLAKEVLNVTPSEAHFRSLTKDDVVKFIYWYWKKIKGDKWKNQLAAEQMCDWHWGSFQAVMKTRRALFQHFNLALKTNVSYISDDLVNMVNKLPATKLNEVIYEARIAHYYSIAPEGHTNRKFLKGWINRTNDQYKKKNSNIGQTVDSVEPYTFSNSKKQ